MGACIELVSLQEIIEKRRMFFPDLIGLVDCYETILVVIKHRFECLKIGC